MDGRQQEKVEIASEDNSGEYHMTEERCFLESLAAGTHSVTLGLESNPGELELDYFVIHSKGAAPEP